MNTVESSKQVTEEDKQKPTGVFSVLSFRAAEILGFGATLGSGALAAWSGIREHFYRNVSRYGVFKDVHDVRDNRMRDLYKEFAGHGNKEELIARTRAIESEYTNEVVHRMEGLGIKTTLDRWRTLKTHQKSEVIVAVAGVSAILLGAVVNLSASRSIRERQEALNTQINENNEHMSM